MDVLTVYEYPSTSYEPQMEYCDGGLVDRNVGEAQHARLQAMLAAYIWNRHRDWKVAAYIAMTMNLRENGYALPDICVYAGARSPCSGLKCRTDIRVFRCLPAAVAISVVPRFNGCAEALHRKNQS